MKRLLLVLPFVIASNAANAFCRYTVTSEHDFVPRPANDNDALNNQQCELYEALQNVGYKKDVFEDCACLDDISIKSPEVRFAPSVTRIVIGNGFVEAGANPGAKPGENDALHIHPNTAAVRIVGPVDISGNHRNRIFVIEGTTDVELDATNLFDGTSNFVDGQIIPKVGSGGHILLTNSAANLTLKNLTLKNGRAVLGGSIWSGGGKLVMDEVRCESNQAHGNGTLGSGRGGCLDGGATLVELKSSTFQFNNADSGGGAFSNLNPGAVVTAERVAFLGNRDRATDGAGGGGATSMLAEFVCDKCTYDGNWSAVFGGAHHQGPSGSCATFTATLFNANMVTHLESGGGGGAVLAQGCVRVVNSTARMNYVNHPKPGGGGFIVVDGGEVEIGNTTFYGNAVYGPSKYGAVALITGNSLLHFVNNTVVDNEGPEALYWLAAAPGEVFNNLLSHADGLTCDGDTGALAVGSNLEHPAATCGDSVVADPKLVGPVMPKDPISGLPTWAAKLGHRQYEATGFEAKNFKGDPTACTLPPISLKDKNGKARDTYCSLGDLEH